MTPRLKKHRSNSQLRCLDRFAIVCKEMIGCLHDNEIKIWSKTLVIINNIIRLLFKSTKKL